MTSNPLAAVERSVRRARRRLLIDRLLHASAVGLTAGLGVGLTWFLAEPWVLQTPPDWLRWAVLGSTAGVGFVAAVVWSVLTRPTVAAAALELDRRFELHERATTALGLTPDLCATPAGQAVLSDASAKVAPLPIGEKFPVRPRPSLAGVPVLAFAIALVAVFYHPDTANLLGADEKDATVAKKADDVKKAADPKKPDVPFTKQRPPELARKKSADLEKLEAELDEMMEKWAKKHEPTEDQKREKVTELTAMEEKVRKFKEQEEQKLRQMEQQLQQLDRLSRDKEFEDGPMKDLQKALSKGDLSKAEDAIDELKKKIKDKKLDEAEMAKLDKQIEKMKEEMQKAAGNKEKQDALKKKIQDAKKEGKDAAGLERELEKMQAEQKQSAEAMDRMAERMQKMKQALKDGNQQDAEDALDGLASDLKNIEEDLKDLEDADDYLQRLKDELKKACKGCEGKCQGDQFKEKDDADWTPEGRPGAGKRKENPNAKSSSKDEKISGLFDPKGKKSFGGTTKGPAFTKRSGVEMGREIAEAVQEAPQTPDVQKLPRDTQSGVKEYYERIGGSK